MNALSQILSLSDALMVVAVLLFAGACIFGAGGIYGALIKPFSDELAMQQGEGRVLAAVRTVFLTRLGQINEPLLTRSYEERIRRMLVSAGNPGDLTPGEFLGLQELGAGMLGLGGLSLLPAGLAPIWVVAFAALGFLYPMLWLSETLKRRHLLIIRAMPYNLDLLTLSVEAGLDFAAALAKVVEKGKPGPFNEECALVLKQLKMGKTREEALKGMVQRVNLPPLSTFVTALVQADKMGTSLGKVLRIQSTQLRLERTQRAEKLANEAPVKMLFPLLFFIFPCVFLILFGPTVFQFTFGGGVGG
jgi:tight adherence protein C